MSGCATAVEGNAAEDLQQTCDAGNVTTTAIAVGGAAVADAVATDNDAVVGDLTTDDHGVTVVTTRFGFLGASNVAGARDAGLRFDTTGNVIWTYINTAIRYHTTINEFRPEGNLFRGIGVDGARFNRIFVGHPVFGVLSVGDASSALDDDMYIVVEEPAAGNNDLTAPAAWIGAWYRIRISVARAGNVRFDTTGGDTVNGLAAPLILAGAPTTYTCIKETAADWRVEVE